MKIPIPSIPSILRFTRVSPAAPALLAASVFLLPVLTSRAEITVTVDHNEGEEAKPALHFKAVRNDLDNVLNTSVSISLLEGQQDDHSAAPDVLFDGKSPTEEDEPDQNFFFKDGDDGGRLLVTLGETIPIKEIDTYSWHPDTRAPQVYKLYASDGSGKDFVADPKRPQDPAACGWKLIASVDTRKKFASAGGQYGVSLKDSAAALGNYRYLLFDVFSTEGDDAFGNTFYSEINVISADESADKTADESSDKTAAGPVKTERAVWLGVLCEEVTEDLRNTLPLTPGTGLIVRDVSPDSPASQAGLQKYDVLTKLEDQQLVNASQLQSLVRGKHDGDTVHVAYLRHGQPGTAEAKLGTHEAPAGKEIIVIAPVLNLDKGGDHQGIDFRKLMPKDSSASGRSKTILIDKNGKVIEATIDGPEPGDQTRAGADKAFKGLEKTLREQGVDEEGIKRIEKQITDKILEAAKGKKHASAKSPAEDTEEAQDNGN